MTTNAGGGYEGATRGIVLTEHDVMELERLIHSRSAFDRHDPEHIEALARELEPDFHRGQAWDGRATEENWS